MLGTVAFVFAAGSALAVGFGFLPCNTAGALVTVFVVMPVLSILLLQFGSEWLITLAQHLPGPRTRRRRVPGSPTPPTGPHAGKTRN